MSEEENNTDWLGCPNSVKAALPKKIAQAVSFALDECFQEVVGEPAAQRDKWVYKEIKRRICEAMKGWVEEAMDEAIGKALEK